MVVKTKRPTKKKVIKKPVVSPTKTAEELVDDNVAKMKEAGKWVVFCVRIEDGKVCVERTAVAFPKVEIDTTIRLIVEDLQKLKAL